MAQPTFFTKPPATALAEIATLTKAQLVDPARGGHVITGYWPGITWLTDAGAVPTIAPGVGKVTILTFIPIAPGAFLGMLTAAQT